jgi:hypothetical protein
MHSATHKVRYRSKKEMAEASGAAASESAASALAQEGARESAASALVGAVAVALDVLVPGTGVGMADIWSVE